MSSTVLLFIGGPKDGDRESVPDSTFEMRALFTAALGFNLRNASEEFSPTRVSYVRRRLIFGEVMVLSGMTEEAVVGALVQGYRPGPVIDVSEQDISDAVYSKEGLPIIQQGGRPNLLVMKMPYVPDPVPA